MKLTTLVTAAILACTATASYALDKVTFGTNWLAQAEHGGFYQSVADGAYKQCGLDVTIILGGPAGALIPRTL